MKSITNTSLQSWSLPFRTSEGIKSFFLTPRQTIKVPTSYLTEDVVRYQERNLIKIKDV
jgi:hypothetical protein